MVGRARFRRDQSGIAVTEFGLLAPVMMILLMGGFDAGHRLYARAVLEGAVQKAARDSGLENGSLAARQTAVDDKVLDQIGNLRNGLTRTCANDTVPRICFDRRSYRSFATAATPAETYDDTNNDGLCNNGEPWTDINRNGTRDADIGVVGQGGAEDAVVYTVRIVFPPITPVGKVLGMAGNVDLSARTVLRNQPYNDQGSDPPPIVRNCT